MRDLWRIGTEMAAQMFVLEVSPGGPPVPDLLG